MKKSLFAIALLAVFASAAAAQVSSNVQQVKLVAVVPEYLTLDQPSAPVVNFAITPMNIGNTLGDTAPSFNTNWSLKPGRNVTICAYLSGPLTGSDTNNKETIGTGAILAKWSSTGTFAPFDGNTACAMGSGLVISTTAVTSATHTYTALSTVYLAIAGPQAKFPDTYNGILNFVAQAQ